MLVGAASKSTSAVHIQLYSHSSSNLFLDDSLASYSRREAEEVFLLQLLKELRNREG